MKLTFESYDEGFGSTLKCPSCGFNYLHHERVEVFERKEDASDGLHVVVEAGNAHTDSNLSENPSPRRHGLAVHFRCEGCAARPVLTISQHKGNTLIDLN